MLTIVRGPDLTYFTVPSLRANSVKSRPMPTLRAGVEDGADLANQDVAGQDDLTAVALDPAPLRLRVAAVAGAPLTFFVSHGLQPFAPARMAVILSDGERLPVARLAAVALAALVLEDDDLLAEPLLDDLGLDRDAGDGRLADLDPAAVVGEQERPERHLGAGGPASFSTRRVSPSRRGTVFHLRR